MAKSARRNQKKNRSSKRRRVVKGGSGAADWALATFGGPGQQHAQAGSNLIAVRDASVPVVVAGQAGGMLALTPAQAGGMGHLSPAVLKGGKKGGALFALSPMALSEVKIVNDVANVGVVKGGNGNMLHLDGKTYNIVPTLNIPARQPSGQYGSQQDAMPAAMQNAMQALGQAVGQSAPVDEGEAPAPDQGEPVPVDEGEVVPADEGEVVPADEGEVVPADEAPADEAPVAGGSLLNDIAVPAVLLLGNRMFRGKRSSAKRNAKRNPKRTSSRRARR